MENKHSEVLGIGERERVRDRGTKAKKQPRKPAKRREQSKFFVDLNQEKENLKLIFGLLEKCNQKSYGREILFKDLCLYAVAKIMDKDIEKIQEMSLSEMERVERALDEHNKKAGTILSLGEFLVKKLGIN